MGSADRKGPINREDEASEAGRNPGLLICIAAVAAIVRWLVMATEPGVLVLIVTQLLHGISSSGALLGIMLMIAVRVPLPVSAAAQGLNAVLLGLVLAIVTAGSGFLWSFGTGPAYLAMASLAVLGFAAALTIIRAEPSAQAGA